MMHTPAEHARLLRLATGASVAVALTLIVAKAVAWWLSGSVSILAGLTDSLMDGAASLINLFAVHYALKPADADHRFGHGKAEALAGLAQALFISISAVLIGLQAFERLRNPQELHAEGLGIAVMLFSLVLTVALITLQRHVVRITGSTAVQADSLHYRSDILLNGSILLALVLAGLGWHAVDPLFGLAIALYILWSSLGIGRQSVAVLMDQELPAEISQRMQLLACSVEGVLGVHDLRTRMSGTRWHVQLHLELDPQISLSAAHTLCDAAENRICAEFPNAEVLVHADPKH
jgi:cation diffusion facilitator family transporter